MLEDIAGWGWADAPTRRLVFAADIPKLDKALPRALSPCEPRPEGDRIAIASHLGRGDSSDTAKVILGRPRRPERAGIRIPGQGRSHAASRANRVYEAFLRRLRRLRTQGLVICAANGSAPASSSSGIDSVATSTS
jgi:hypothetical protein